MPIILEEQQRPRCFIAMPMATRAAEAEKYGDPDHWEHVMNTLFVPAVTAAGYEPIIPMATGAHLIHERIVKNLSECDLVLCDLSANNPNVFFELGVRTSLNLPISLVYDGLTTLPFDTSGINTFKYGPKLHSWEIEEQREQLASHVTASSESCAGTNPLWRQFGLKLTAEEPTSGGSPADAKLDVLAQQVSKLVERQQVVDQQERWRKFSEASWGGAELLRPLRTGGEGQSRGSITTTAAALDLVRRIRNWADGGKRKVTAVPSLNDQNLVEVHVIDGDELTAADIEMLDAMARDHGVGLALFSPGHGAETAEDWEDQG